MACACVRAYLLYQDRAFEEGKGHFDFVIALVAPRCSDRIILKWESTDAISHVSTHTTQQEKTFLGLLSLELLSCD